MIQLLKDYPKAGEVIKTHFLNEMLKSLNDENLPEDFKDHVRLQGMDDDRFVSILGNAPRALFDVFDNNRIYISIVFDHDNQIFWFGVNDKNSEKKYLFRKSAEQAAIIEAFKILNDALTDVEQC